MFKDIRQHLDEGCRMISLDSLPIVALVGCGGDHLPSPSLARPQVCALRQNSLYVGLRLVSTLLSRPLILLIELANLA